MKFIKRIILVIILIDNFLSNTLKNLFKTRYKLGEGCKRCGRCCREIAFYVEDPLLNHKFSREIIIRWTSWIFDFYLIRIEYDKNYIIFGCKHLSPALKCLNYKWRPSVCRNYPLVDYFAKPVLFPWCGYSIKFKS